MNRKIIPKQKLKRIISALKKQNKKIVFTNGCFDILHAGHVRYLYKAKKMGDVLIIAVNSDKSVKKIKGDKRPVVGQKDRQEVLAGLGCVDYVVLFNEDTPKKIIEYLKPDILIKGGDYKVRDIVGYDTLKKCGGKVVTVPLVKGRSTTDLLKKICETCTE